MPANELCARIRWGWLGCVSEVLLQGLVYAKTGTGLPFETFLVNVLGCFLIGVFMSSTEERFLVHPSIRIFLTIRILGGFATFSSFSFETIALFRDGELLYGLFNIFGSLILCLTGTWVGIQLGKLI